MVRQGSRRVRHHRAAPSRQPRPSILVPTGAHHVGRVLSFRSLLEVIRVDAPPVAGVAGRVAVLAHVPCQQSRCDRAAELPLEHHSMNPEHLAVEGDFGVARPRHRPSPDVADARTISPPLDAGPHVARRLVARTAAVPTASIRHLGRSTEENHPASGAGSLSEETGAVSATRPTPNSIAGVHQDDSATGGAGKLDGHADSPQCAVPPVVSATRGRFSQRVHHAPGRSSRTMRRG